MKPEFPPVRPADAVARPTAGVGVAMSKGPLKSHPASVPFAATITVAGEGPKRKTQAKTKASDTENRASTDGTLIENEPVSRVSAARTNH